MNSTTATKGFRTFILTLSVSLIVFSVIYYVLTSVTPSEPSLFTSEDMNKSEMALEVSKDINNEDTTNSDVQGVSDVADDSKDEEKTVFGSLAEDKPNVQAKRVLAGSTVNETTQSTTAVPETGVFGITFGLLMSFFLFLIAMIIVYLNPRKLALLGFEKDILKELD